MGLALPTRIRRNKPGMPIRAFLKKAADWLLAPGWAGTPPWGWGGVRLKKGPDASGRGQQHWG